MTLSLTAVLAYVEDNPDLGCNENAAFRCEAAKRFEDAGDYASAAEVMGELWAGPGHEPNLDGLDQRTGGLALLRIGFLEYRQAHTRVVGEPYEGAKDSLYRAQRLFEGLGDAERVAEAVNGLALCAWRQGDFDSAKMLLDGVLSRRPDEVGEQRMVAIVALAAVEWEAKHYAESLAVLQRNAALFDGCGNHRLLAGYRVARGLALRHFGQIDEALIEYAAASYHLEMAGDVRQSAYTDNNVGFAQTRLGRGKEARSLFSEARRKFKRVGDDYGHARVDDSEAQLCISEGRYEEAEQLAARAEGALAHCDKPAALAETIMTRGKALARMGRGAAAWDAFDRAYDIALDRLGSAEAERIRETACDELLVALVSEKGMTSHGAKRRVERALIKRGLEDTRGNQRQAALRIGMKQQRINELLKSSCKDILEEWDQRRRA